jgi:hypothetical protein
MTLQTSAEPPNQHTAVAMVLIGVATFALGFGADLAAAHDWSEVTTPAFVGKTLMQVGGVIGALYGAKRLRP